MSRRSSRVLIFLSAVLGLMGACAIPASASPLPPVPGQTLQQAISDQAQGTTIGFSGVAMLTGNLEAQSFFPPGKVADYWGFQYLRDNDPSNMGHNTSFLTRVACNVLFTLDSGQVGKLKALATSQVGQINEYGYTRYPLMKAFRRLVDGDLPAGAAGLDPVAVKAASKDLYVLDGQISYDRAVAYANIFRSLSATQKAYLDAMVGKGWSAWPDKTMADVREKTAGLSHDESVDVMTYAGDMYSWYAGSLDADVYFCPERHGTYYGGFYIKDAPAIGHEGYSINEQLTATAGACLADSGKGYVTADQAALISGLVDAQRSNLYAGADNIVKARTDISTALRSLISSSAPTAALLAQVKATVLARSGAYGELDGENNYHYATAFAKLESSLSAAQKTKLMDLRKSIMSGTYADGTAFDFTVCATPFLFSAAISDPAVLAPYTANTDYLFGAGSPAASPEAAFSYLPAAPLAGLAVQFTDASTGGPTTWSWTFGDGGASATQNPSHSYAAAGTYTVSLTARNAGGSAATTRVVTVAPLCTITAVTLTQSPFGLTIGGTGFRAGCKVLINGYAAPTLFKSATLLVTQGSVLKAMLPKGVAVQIVVRNPDGATSAPFVFTR